MPITKGSIAKLISKTHTVPVYFGHLMENFSQPQVEKTTPIK